MYCNNYSRRMDLARARWGQTCRVNNSGYTPGMESTDHPSGRGDAGRAWLESLPPAKRQSAGAALEALPRDVEGAGESLPLVVAAWILADPSLAAELLDAWLDTADEKGHLSPSFPVVCQWVEWLCRILPDADAFRLRVLPRLARYLEGTFDRYDVKGTALPVWPSAAEALFPEEYAPERFTVDLPVLLWNEAEAFCCLGKDREQDYAKTLDMAEGEQRELDVWLKETFWNVETAMFHRYDQDRNIPDTSPCGVVPLVWRGRTQNMTEALRGRATNGETRGGGVRAHSLFFALLLRTPHNTLVARMLREGLPSAPTAIEAAVWGVLSAAADQARAAYTHDIPAAVRWLDIHGRGVARVGMSVAALLLLLLLGWGIAQRERLPMADLVELERQAQRAADEGQHDRAAMLYGRAARHGRSAYFRYRQAGEWLRQGHGEAAERAYRELLREEPRAPNVRLNLALAVWQQGRREEAVELYREVAQDPALAAYPDVVRRAQLALELAARQMALDRED